VRLESTADVAVSCADLYTLAADLRNLPAWWIEHLSAEIEIPAVRARDAVYRVRYRLPGGLIISATCTVIAARQARSVTYVWEGGGMRTAVGQSFAPSRIGCRTCLVADVSVGRWLSLLGPLVTQLMRHNLRGELDRALLTLGELASAKTVLRRTAIDRRQATPRAWGAAPAAGSARAGDAG